jgi:uncharacterized protein YdeI (BOF family)
MEKRVVSLILLAIVLLIPFAFAAQGGNEPGTGITNSELKESGQGTGQGLQANTSTEQQTQNNGNESQIEAQVQVRQRVMAGVYTNDNGNQMQIRAENGIKLRVGDAEAHSLLNMSQEMVQNRTRLNAQLSNGRNVEIKIMPDTASERAIERLRIKNCNSENNCTIQLKEVGQGEQTRATYEVQAENQFRLLGLFKTKAKVMAQIDAEDGEVIQLNKPWWAFMATSQ